MRYLILLTLVACNLESWNPHIVSTASNGWHPCGHTGYGCPENYICVKDGCEAWGDPNGPGFGDVEQENSSPAYGGTP